MGVSGGKQKENESLEETVLREIKEETNLIINVQENIKSVKHAYSHFKITLHAFKCDYISGTEKNNSTDELKWVKPNELINYPFPKANKTIVETILNKRSN